jgi:hypothetical protein
MSHAHDPRGRRGRVTPAQLAAAAGPPAVNSPVVAGAGDIDHKTAAELLITAQRQQLDVAAALDQLVRLVDRRPAQLRDVVLRSAIPQSRVDGEAALSFGVYNPSSVLVYSNLAGNQPAPGRGALSFPGRSLVVLPLAVEDDLTIGAAPADLAAGDLVVWVLLFSTVQAASMETLS